MRLGVGVSVRVREGQFTFGPACPVVDVETVPALPLERLHVRVAHRPKDSDPLRGLDRGRVRVRVRVRMRVRVRVRVCTAPPVAAPRTGRA